ERPEPADFVPGSSSARKIREWSGCNRVGLDTANAYLLEGRLLSILGVGTGGPHVQHINLGGPDDLSRYCAILCVACETKPAKITQYQAAGFQQAEEKGAVLFYRPCLAQNCPGERSNEK